MQKLLYNIYGDFMNKLAIKLIRFYQKNMRQRYNPCCRFTPSCSNYGIECFQKFTFFKALFLTVFRIIRCNPLSKGGYNPPPLSKIEKQLKHFFKF